MSQGISPVTGVIDESQVIIDFGQHEGKSIREISDIDPSFYSSLAQEKSSGVYAIRKQRDETFRLYLNPLAQLDQ